MEFGIFLAGNDPDALLDQLIAGGYMMVVSAASLLSPLPSPAPARAEA